jgi:hypothetical protein
MVITTADASQPEQPRVGRQGPPIKVRVTMHRGLDASAGTILISAGVSPLTAIPIPFRNGSPLGDTILGDPTA